MDKNNFQARNESKNEKTKQNQIQSRNTRVS